LTSLDVGAYTASSPDLPRSSSHMSVERLYPFAGDHAIQSAVVVAEWAELGGSKPLSSDILQNLERDAKPQLTKLGLTHHEQLNVLEVKMGAGQQTSHASSALGGFKSASRSTMGSDERRSVVLARENCIIQINDYTRWADAVRDIREYLNVLLPSIGQFAPIRHLTLQFNDVFLWKAPSEELNMTEVFRTGTVWLPKHVFGLTNLWHSHHGYFADKSEPCQFQQLDNVNVSRAVVDGLHSIQALVAHRASLAQPIWVREPLSEDDDILKILGQFHTDNKRILADLFSNEVLRSINLNAS